MYAGMYMFPSLMDFVSLFTGSLSNSTAFYLIDVEIQVTPDNSHTLLLSRDPTMV